jgi:hypothetical protein
VSSTQLVQVSNKLNDGYRFGCNGQEKDDEVSGEGNHLDFTERRMDTRVGRLGWSVDPLGSKFPGQSPYSYGGNNPIWLIDKKGEIKTVYNVVIDERNRGKAQISIITSPGLMSVAQYNKAFYGSLSFNWYDFSLISITKIDKYGAASTTSSGPIKGTFRTNTLFQIPWYAGLKTDDFKEKDKGSFAGFSLFSKGADGSDNGFNPNAASGSKSFDVGPILQMFSRMNTIKGDQGLDGLVDMVKYLKDASDILNNNQQDDNHLNLNRGVKGVGKKDTIQCDIPGGCGELHVGDRIGVKPAENKRLEDYPKSNK